MTTWGDSKGLMLDSFICLFTLPAQVLSILIDWLKFHNAKECLEKLQKSPSLMDPPSNEISGIDSLLTIVTNNVEGSLTSEL